MGLLVTSSLLPLLDASDVHGVSCTHAWWYVTQLKLPQYSTFEELEAKVLVAIRHGCEGFQFV